MLPLRLPYEQMQQKWASEINPVLNLPLVQGVQLTEVPLSTGVNVINHKLSRTQQGFVITDIQGAAQIYRSQPFNNLTLTLTSDADIVISMWVY